MELQSNTLHRVSTYEKSLISNRRERLARIAAKAIPDVKKIDPPIQSKPHKTWAVNFLLPDECLTPHAVTHEEKVSDLSNEMAIRGWNGRALLGYPWEDAFQLLSGSHRYAACAMLRRPMPVYIIPYEHVADCWGTSAWPMMMARTPWVSAPAPIEPRPDGLCPTVAAIQHAVWDVFPTKGSLAAVCGNSRFASIIRPRHIGMFLCRTLINDRHGDPISLPQIGRLYSGKDHTTALNAYKKIAAHIEAGGEVCDQTNAVLARLRASGYDVPDKAAPLPKGRFSRTPRRFTPTEATNAND